MQKYFSRELVYSFMNLHFWYFATEGWHYTFYQSSQTVKSLYILMNSILGPTLLMHTSLNFGDRELDISIYQGFFLRPSRGVCQANLHQAYKHFVI